MLWIGWLEEISKNRCSQRRKDSECSQLWPCHTQGRVSQPCSGSQCLPRSRMDWLAFATPLRRQALRMDRSSMLPNKKFIIYLFLENDRGPEIFIKKNDKNEITIVYWEK